MPGNEQASPEQIAAERRGSRESLIQPGERVALELARIADTLESMRRDIRALTGPPR